MSRIQKKKCWACRKNAAAKAKAGLCPECFEEIGAGVATVGAFAVTIGGSLLFRKSRPFKGRR